MGRVVVCRGVLAPEGRRASHPRASHACWVGRPHPLSTHPRLRFTPAAVKLVLVEESVADVLVPQIVAGVKALSVGM